VLGRIRLGLPRPDAHADKVITASVTGCGMDPWTPMELQENVRNIDRIATAHLPLRRLIHIRTVVLFAALRVLLHNMVSSQVKCRHDKTGDEPARFCTCQPSLDFERAASAARFYTGGGKVGHSISSVAYI
jgi:hypothetical protein